MAVREERRYEIKMSFHLLQLSWLVAAVRTHPAGFLVAYPARTVNSAYLDTPDLRYFNENREGFGERNKVRIRWYGESASGVAAALEVKRRHVQANTKLVHPLAQPLDLGGGATWPQVLDDVRRDLPIELAEAVSWACRPVVINRYRREYFATADGEIRATLDYNQQSFSQLACLRPNLTWAVPPTYLAVLEVKAPLSAHDRLLDVTSWMPARTSRNSKYAIAVERALHA
jgi:hypothetical protein